jgi:hypothetical protein
MHKNFWAFFGFWVFQARPLRTLSVPRRRLGHWRARKQLVFTSASVQMLWVWVVSLPVTLLNSSANDPAIDGRDIAGYVMFVSAATRGSGVRRLTRAARRASAS